MVVRPRAGPGHNEAIASAELGVREAPPGSNDAPRIAEYRTATVGSSPAPWCTYFCSWVARQAGVPIGEGGRGQGSVPAVKEWGERTGRDIAPGTASPQAGGMVLFDRGGDGMLDHIGVVTGVAADGSISTVEGNSSDAVSARSDGPGEYAGLVRLVRLVRLVPAGVEASPVARFSTPCSRGPA